MSLRTRLPDRRRAARATKSGSEIGLSRLGSRVVIRTLSGQKGRLPLVVGYADSRRQWYRDGRRHVGTPSAARQDQGIEIGL